MRGVAHVADRVEDRLWWAHARYRSALHAGREGRGPHPRQEAFACRLCRLRPESDRRCPTQAQLLSRGDGGGGTARCQGCRAGRGPGRQARAAARRARQHKGPCRRPGCADAARLGDLRGQCCSLRRRRAGAAPARGRRHRRRQVDDTGVRRQGPDRRPVLRRHAQSVESRAHTGRLERRRCGRGRRRAGPAGARHRRRGLGARSGLVLGPGRTEADPGRGAGRHLARRLRQQRLCRPTRPHHHRCRDHASRAGRPQRQGPVDARGRRAAAALAQAFERGSFGCAHRLYRAHRQSADCRRRARQHARVACRLAGNGRRGRGDHRENRLDRI